MNSIRWADVTHNIISLKYIILDDTKTMDTPINNIIKIFINMDFPDRGNRIL